MRSPCSCVCVWECLYLNFLKLHPIIIKLGMYIVPPEAISTSYFLNPSHKKYQHCIPSNCVVLLTSLRKKIQSFICICIKYTDSKKEN
jgi:hypothetical protein